MTKYMLKNYTLIALSCLFISFISSCTKDSTGSSNTGGTSSYSFNGSPGSCSSPVVAGIYSIGRVLDASNTLTFTVNVSVKGTYSINTTASNGVFFSGSGTFTTTGPQALVLTGSGTPIKAGNFPFVPVTNNTCNFTVSFLNGAPAAVFTYAGAPGSCSAPAINGVYASGVALGAGNYVDLAVNVTTPGAYTVSTTSANGMSFSGSGSFSATGSQVIRLIGNGTPSGQGTFAFTPSGGCSFSITVGAPPPPASFTYNGAPGSCTSPLINGTFAAGTALTSSSTIKLGVIVTVAGTYSVTTSPSNGVTFSASGVFPGTGAQTITLTSTNTPTAGGTFTYTPSGGCSFDVTYTTGPPPPADFIKCTIDGVLINFAVDPFGTDGNTSAPYMIDFDASLTIGGDNFAISITDQNNPVVTGVDYGNRNLLAGPTKFCEITYATGSGFPWGSSITNNSFVVRLTSLTATTVTGTFSGKVYSDLGTGTTFKTITNGTFSITF
jgi:hypothetical protein